MNRRQKLLLAVAVLVGLLLVGGVWAANSVPAIDWWVFGSGGAPSSGGTVEMDDTLGQAVIGPSGGGDVSLHAGYWYELEAGLPALAIAKAAQPSSATPGQTITFTIVVANNGGAVATGGVVSDALPAGLTFAGPVTLDPPGAGTVGTPPALVTDATISAGGSITVTFPATVNLYVAPGTITNTAASHCSEGPTPIEASAPITVANAKPILGTVDPASGSGPTGVTTYFTTTWMDDNGWADLKQCYFHIADSPSIVGSVTLLYNAAKDKLWLRTDDGNAWIGGCAPESAGVMENGQAKVYCGLSTADGTDGTVTVKWAIEFKDGYTGDKKLGMKCKDRSKAKAKGKWKGTWTIE